MIKPSKNGIKIPDNYKMKMSFEEAMNGLMTGFFPGYEDCDSYIVTNANQNNVFSGKFIGFTTDIGCHNLVYRDKDGIIKNDNKYNFEKTYPDILGSSNIFALKIPRSELNNKLCDLIGKELSDKDLYYSVFEQKLYTYDQIQFSSKVICEVDDSIIPSMIESYCLQNAMVPTKEGSYYNLINHKRYIQSEVYPEFFVEEGENKIFMEQILLGGIS